MTDAAPKTSIQQAIERAKSGAGALAAGLPTIENQAPVIQAAATGVGQYAPAPIASLDAFLDAGVNIKPDVWIGVKSTGFSIKDHTTPIDHKGLGPLGLSLPNDMQAFYGLRLRVGGQPVYYKTADRITCLKTGRLWGALLQEAAAQDEREYRGFDIRLVALQDIKDLKGAVVIEAGKTLGYTTSVTNYDDFTTFAKKVRDQGLFGQDLVLEVECEVRKNDKSKDGWGAMVVKDFAVFTAEVAQAVADAT